MNRINKIVILKLISQNMTNFNSLISIHKQKKKITKWKRVTGKQQKNLKTHISPPRTPNISLYEHRRPIKHPKPFGQRMKHTNTHWIYGG